MPHVLLGLTGMCVSCITLAGYDAWLESHVYMDGIGRVASVTCTTLVDWDAWLVSHALHWWTGNSGSCHMYYIGGLGHLACVTCITLAGKDLWFMSHELH